MILEAIKEFYMEFRLQKKVMINCAAVTFKTEVPDIEKS